MTYRSQHGVHELVRRLGSHQATHFEHTERQPGDDGRMLCQRLLQYLAISLVVIEGADLWDAAKTLKGSEI
jgi:hypothetical protein